MAATTIANLVTPAVYSAYMEAMLPERIKLVSSGLATIDANPEISTKGGTTFNIPFYNDMSGSADEVVAQGTPNTVTAIAASNDIGVVNYRSKTFGYSDASEVFSGSDPGAEISRQWANYWARRIDISFNKVLEGTLTALGATHQLDRTGAVDKAPSADNILATAQLLGDNQDQLSIVYCHSKVFNYWLSNGFISYVSGTTFTERVVQSGQVPTVFGKQVVVSDGAYNSGTTYGVYIGAPGQLYLGYQRALKLEDFRDPKAQQTELTGSIFYVAHNRFVKWTGTAAGLTPTNTELGTSGNWSNVADNNKNIKLVQLLCTLN